MSTVSDERIQPALHALLSNDAPGLGSALADDPELANVAWNGNTLLEWATQPPHGIDRECVAVLIDAGASLDRALGLAGCFNLAELCTQLLDAGGDPTSFESDVSPITPLESAAMHGSAAAADVLVEHGLHRPTLWLAAATGQLDLVTEWVSHDPTLLKPAGDYRPIWAHVGRPPAPAPTSNPHRYSVKHSRWQPQTAGSRSSTTSWRAVCRSTQRPTEASPASTSQSNSAN